MSKAVNKVDIYKKALAFQIPTESGKQKQGTVREQQACCMSGRRLGNRPPGGSLLAEYFQMEPRHHQRLCRNILLLGFVVVEYVMWIFCFFL